MRCLEISRARLVNGFAPSSLPSLNGAMIDQADAEPRRRLGGICLIAAPLLLFVADLFQVFSGYGFVWTTIDWVAFVFFIPAALALGHVTRPQCNLLGLVGSGCVIVGAMAAAQTIALFRIRGVLLHGVPGLPADTLQRIFKADPRLFLTIFPLGLFFSTGLILLGLALLRTGRFGLVAPVLLALGGLIFPFGHAAGVAAGLFAGDLLLVIGMSWLGQRILTEPGAW
jgi:hypothetical protein